MTAPASDAELLGRQARLQEQAGSLLREVSPALAHVGPLEPMGSYVSGLMAWPDLDVGLLVGPEFSPLDVLDLLARVVALPGVAGFEFRDERGARCPTGQARDERYHVPVVLDRAGVAWRLDLSLWLRDVHRNITEWHERLRHTVTTEQRTAILRIKDVWHRRPDYPDLVGGQDVYAAVIDGGVRSPAAFGEWLAGRAGAPRTRPGSP